MERKYGSDLAVDLLQLFGVEYAALNPGSTFRGLHDSIVNYGANRPEIILCPHEEVAVAMAHGYAKVTGRPMAAIVHDVVGLLHASMALRVPGSRPGAGAGGNRAHGDDAPAAAHRLDPYRRGAGRCRARLHKVGLPALRRSGRGRVVRPRLPHGNHRPAGPGVPLL
jgi:Thiamine pyrophosphate enzyme, N-terminal TPP binding domain